MFEKIMTAIKRGLVRIGLIKEINSLIEHKELMVNEQAYNRIRKNKDIYNGYHKEWHHIDYLNSVGDKKTRDMVRLGMGKVVAHEMASLIFNERVQVDVNTRGYEGDNDEVAEFIQQTLKDNGFHKNFQRYYEYCMALSGMAIKVYHHNGKVKLSWASADSFFPLGNDSETIDEAVFVTEEQKDGMYYTLLEWNTWEGDTYVVRNELYESKDKGKLGVKVPLSKVYENLQETAYIDGLSRPLFVYIKPNTANNKDINSPLGISIYENAYDTLYSLDYLYDFLMNEFKLGVRRIAVEPSMLKSLPKYNDMRQVVGMTQAFDTDETVFTGIAGEGDGIKDLTVSLRVDEIVQAINTQLEILSMQTGLSAGTFTFDGKTVKTATEVVSENSKTYKTKNSHEQLVAEGIKELITTIVDVASLYELIPMTEVDVSVNFDDSIAQDRDKNLEYYSTMVNMDMIPLVEAIQRVANVNEDTARKWLTERQKEKAMSMQLIQSHEVDMFNIAPNDME